MTRIPKTARDTDAIDVATGTGLARHLANAAPALLGWTRGNDQLTLDLAELSWPIS